MIKISDQGVGHGFRFNNHKSNSRGNFLIVRRLVLPVFIAIVLVLPVQALTINATYDSTVTSLTNAAQVEAAFGAAVQMFQNQYTNPITINITVSFSDSVDLGASQTALVGNPTYAQLTNALRAARMTAADTNAVASLPATDPTGGPWWIPRAEMKALKISGFGVSANDTVNDGAVMFATPSADTIYTFDPTERVVAGEWDFIGIAEHEISEAIGRTYRLNLGGGYVPYDLFRFTNNGARSFSTNYATNVYFSVDDGVTQLKFFYPDITTGDIQDWASTAIPDAFDAYVNAGQQLLLSPPDITALDILGYNVAPIPAPHLTGVVLAGGALQFSFTNTPAVSYTVLVSTNLTTPLNNWTVLGAPIENPPGHFQFTDMSGTGGVQQFYRVRSP
jgi:archaellin